MDVIKVTKNRHTLFQVPKEVYCLLFDHTVARRRDPYLVSIQENSIRYSDLKNLCKAAEIPYPLLLAPIDVIEREIAKFEKMVFYGVSKSELALSSRGNVKLADISLILKDLTRKQSLLRKHVASDNTFPDYFKRRKLDITEKVYELSELTGYRAQDVATLSKEATFNHLRGLLAEKNIYVSLYMHNFCPQQISPNLKFSGICIKDKKCPYIFVRAGDENSAVELWGRRLFTLALLLACMCNGKFGTVSLDGRSRDLIDDNQYMLAEELLMPSCQLLEKKVASILDIKELSDTFSTSPSAMVMRLFRLKIISDDEKNAYLDILNEDYTKLISQKDGGRRPSVEKAVTQYNSPRLVKTVTDLVISGGMSERDARNLLYYKKGDSFSLEGLTQYAA